MATLWKLQSSVTCPGDWGPKETVLQADVPKSFDTAESEKKKWFFFFNLANSVHHSQFHSLCHHIPSVLFLLKHKDQICHLSGEK